MATLTMFGELDLRLAELLSARLCHELSGPVAAVGNGVELLADDDAEFAAEALALVVDSARRAASRLQFYRFAYGFCGEAATAGAPPHELAGRFFEGQPIACDFAEGVRALPLAWQQLGCNLLLVGAEALIRGGRLVLDVAPAGIRLDAVGHAVSLAAEQERALRLEPSVAELTTRTVTAYFAGLLARDCGWGLVARAEPGRMRLYAIAGAA